MRPSATSSTIQREMPENGSVPDVAALESLATVPRTPALGFADKTGAAFGAVSAFVVPRTPALWAVDGVTAVFEDVAAVFDADAVLLDVLELVFELTAEFELIDVFELEAAFDSETADRFDAELVVTGGHGPAVEPSTMSRPS